MLGAEPALPKGFPETAEPDAHSIPRRSWINFSSVQRTCQGRVEKTVPHFLWGSVPEKTSPPKAEPHTHSDSSTGIIPAKKTGSFLATKWSVVKCRTRWVWGRMGRKLHRLPLEGRAGQKKGKKCPGKGANVTEQVRGERGATPMRALGDC